MRNDAVGRICRETGVTRGQLVALVRVAVALVEDAQYGSSDCPDVDLVPSWVLAAVIDTPSGPRRTARAMDVLSRRGQYGVCEACGARVRTTRGLSWQHCGAPDERGVRRVCPTRATRDTTVEPLPPTAQYGVSPVRMYRRST